MILPFESMILLVILSFLVGIVASMVGIGGGVFIVPFLTLIFDFTPHKAVGTSLAVIVFTSIASTIAYSRQKRIDYKIGLLLVASTIPGAMTGAYLTTLIQGRVLGIIFALFLLFVAFKMTFNLNIIQISVPSWRFGCWRRRLIDSDGKVFEYGANILLGSFLGFFGGASSGLLGIGGGALIVPILHFIVGVPIHITVATSMFIMIFTSISGVIQHITYGNVSFEYAMFMALGVIFGAQIGAHIAKKVGGKLLRRIFAIVLIIMSVRLLLKFIPP